MSRKSFTISDDLLNKALEMTHRRMSYRDVAPGYREYYTPCGSSHAGHIVTVTEGRAVCDCAAFGVCKHVLSSYGRVALHCIQQLRWSRDIEDVQAALDYYEAELYRLPAALRNLVTLEAQACRERFNRESSELHKTLKTLIDEGWIIRHVAPVGETYYIGYTKD
jgi:hypothetical protein